MLHITNGDYFNDCFLKAHAGVLAIPFREAMMDGEVPDAPVFSDAFVRLRARHHGVTEERYRESIEGLLHLNGHATLLLFFGRDTFCQINLLTLLAYLEEIGYTGRVSLTLIDDETVSVLKENVPITLGNYRETYRALLIERRMPADLGVIDAHAVELYFDYLSKDGLLARTVRAHAEEDETALICRLLRISAEYGLSDVMAKELINKHKK